MKSTNKTVSAYNVYDLSNPHFQNAEIFTKDNKSIKGEFVNFKVLENSNNKYKIYPSEKLCFLPIEKRNEFWNSYNTGNGVFKKLPSYIKEFGLNDIQKIIIEPLLVV